MSFEIDSETLNDLEIFTNRSGTQSLFAIFDKTKTEGGTRLLYKIMQEPTSDQQVLVQRRDTISFFYQHNLELLITHHQLDMIDHYLNFNKSCLGPNFIDAIYDHYAYKINPTTDYYIILTGITELIKLLRLLAQFIDKIQSIQPPDCLAPKLLAIKELLNTTALNRHLSSEKSSRFSINRLDNVFRNTYKTEVRALLAFVYEVDVLEAIAGIIKKTNWCFPEYRTDQMNEVEMEGLIHPSLVNPIDNDLILSSDTPVVFLTGPNMAGKSSFLKALGIAMYLAHLGFPVPATKMKTPVFKGLITTINLPDDISEGLSHYYSEVKRIKKTASKLLEKGSLFIIFDELFRGTNLKDAFEATLLVTASLSQIKSSKFMVSSHFTELTEDLKKLQGVAFHYFDCIFINNKPKFTYKIKNGVSEERLGMYILLNEGVISTLQKVITKK